MNAKQMAAHFAELSDEHLDKAIGRFCDCIRREPIAQVANFMKLLAAATAEWNKRHPHS